MSDIPPSLSEAIARIDSLVDHYGHLEEVLAISVIKRALAHSLQHEARPLPGEATRTNVTEEAIHG